MAGLAGRLWFAITAIPIGLATEYLPMTDALIVMALSLVVILGGMLALRERIPTKYERVKEPKAPDAQSSSSST